MLANSIAEVMDDLQDLDLRILAFRARHAQYLPAPSAGSSSGSDDGGGGNGDGGGGGGMRPSLSLDKAAAVTNDMVRCTRCGLVLPSRAAPHLPVCGRAVPPGCRGLDVKGGLAGVQRTVRPWTAAACRHEPHCHACQRLAPFHFPPA